MYIPSNMEEYSWKDEHSYYAHVLDYGKHFITLYMIPMRFNGIRITLQILNRATTAITKDFSLIVKGIPDKN
ncbi:hypothetical protein HZS_2883 [Henneguya salminicola]|nr:hypothetical protein HZS_2883 [Henneguya salminicola]